MKWVRRGMVVIAVLIVAVLVFAFANAMRTQRPVGFTSIEVSDAGSNPIRVGVWYPTDARPRPTTLLGMNLMSVAPDAAVAGSDLPLILISHGNGGGPASHADLALALADSGFVVAAPMHTGDNFLDQSAVGTPRWLVDRSRHVHLTIEHLLNVWPGRARLHPDRVGVFGFSAGGFTESAPPADRFVRETRIKAAVVAAPGLGFTFVPDGLRNIKASVQLWSGQRDVNVPEATNAGLIGRALGDRAEFHSVPGAQHFSFLAPCRLMGPPVLCADAEGFDRAAFHAEMNRQVVAFYKKRLAP